MGKKSKSRRIVCTHQRQEGIKAPHLNTSPQQDDFVIYYKRNANVIPVGKCIAPSTWLLLFQHFVSELNAPDGTLFAVTAANIQSHIIIYHTWLSACPDVSCKIEGDVQGRYHSIYVWYTTLAVSLIRPHQPLPTIPTLARSDIATPVKSWVYSSLQGSLLVSSMLSELLGWLRRLEG